METEPTQFGSQLKQAREDSSMTQASLAEEIGVAPQVISDWEKGRRPGPLFPIVFSLEEILEQEGELLTAVMTDKSQITFHTGDLSAKKRQKLVELFRSYYAE
jgi:DNA-binding XRE family transcriptional regulator